MWLLLLWEGGTAPATPVGYTGNILQLTDAVLSIPASTDATLTTSS